MDRSALPLADRIHDALALLTGQRTVRCPEPGCTVRIRYRAVTADEAKRLTDLAIDHTRH
ncbi:hypothetical protein [Streptomyces lavendulae]|uniref:hypothetical protein n=1 Tax=Streptomyces lavendulae TaxID=1914 RepID=UPI0024A327DB|nr:hypothetical protein [Streptomyces lavendulae]GLW00295.1 hypothetical protein Slala05_39260 [Streptomyces lavendulae subsp. lavendulae]